MRASPPADQVEAIVASRSATIGVDLTAEDLAALVEFLSNLSNAQVDWGAFSQGWSMQAEDDGAGVTLTANADAPSPDASTTPTGGVGGVSGPIAPAATPDVRASPIAIVPPHVTSSVTPDPLSSDSSSPSIMATVLEHGRGVGRWWPLPVIGVALLLLGIGARLQPSERPQTWYVSRSRVFWLGRTLRRPPIVQVPRRKRPMVIVTKR